MSCDGCQQVINNQSWVNYKGYTLHPTCWRIMKIHEILISREQPAVNQAKVDGRDEK